MQDYFAMRDFLLPDGTKAFIKGNSYKGFRDGDCLILLDENDNQIAVGIGVGFVIIKDPHSDEITYQ